MISFILKSQLLTMSVFVLVLCLIICGSQSQASSQKYSLPVSKPPGRPLGSDSPIQKNIGDDTFENAYEELRTFDSIGSLVGGGGGSSGAFSGKRLYNTSIALTASMFSYYLPSVTQPGTVTDLVNQAIYGLFGTLAVVLIYAVPLLITGIQQQPDTSSSSSRSSKEDGGNDGSWIKSNLMSVEQIKRVFDEKFRDDIGLDSTKCMQKTICEAHRAPKNKKYGMLALPFQIFYPPPPKDAPEGRATSYQIAAKDGKYGKKDCSKRYKCFFDTLDVGTFLIDWYRLSSDPEYVPKKEDFY